MFLRLSIPETCARQQSCFSEISSETFQNSDTLFPARLNIGKYLFPQQCFPKRHVSNENSHVQVGLISNQPTYFLMRVRIETKIFIIKKTLFSLLKASLLNIYFEEMLNTEGANARGRLISNH